MAYFVLVYDRTRGAIVVGPEAFADVDREAALRRRFELEETWRTNGDVEVVVLGGSSETQIRNTHGRYFKDLAELAR